jgi:hypothetical protein
MQEIGTNSVNMAHIFVSKWIKKITCLLQSLYIILTSDFIVDMPTADYESS